MKPIVQNGFDILFFNPQYKPQPLTQELLQISRQRFLEKSPESNTARLLHSHWFTEVFFIPSGTGEFIINNYKHKVSAGDLIFINSNISHTEYSLDNLTYYCLSISNIHFEVESSSCVVNVHERYDEYLKLFERLIQEFFNDDASSLDFIHNYFERFLLLVKRQFKYSLSANHSELKNFTDANATKSNAVVEIARGYMENNLRYDITLTQLAKMTFVSERHLIRLFTETIGYTPIQYLNRMRISKSMYNLMLRKDSIAEIAMQYGFKSSYAYIKMFKKLTGYTPQQFRLKYVNNIKEAEQLLAKVSEIKNNKPGA